MRRSSPKAGDDLHALLNALLVFRGSEKKGLGSRPVHGDAFLLFVGLQRDGIARMQELREFFSLGQSRISRTCVALAREGLVELSADPANRNFTLVRLTSNGKKVIDDAIAALRGDAPSI